MPTENKLVAGIELLTEVLVQANLSATIIFPLVMGIATLFKGLSNNEASLSEIADKLEAKLDLNDTNIRRRIADARAALGL